MAPRLVGLLLLVLAARLAWVGFHPGPPPPPAPTGLSVEQFLKATERPSWVRLEGGRLDVLEGAFVRSKAGACTDLLVPLRAEAEPVEGPVRIVVRVRADDPLFEMIRQGDALQGEAQAGAFLQRYREAMVPRRTVEGRVLEGASLPERDARRIEGMRAKRAPGFVLLEEGRNPEPPPPDPRLLALAAGAALAGLALLVRRPRAAGPSPKRPPGDPVEAPAAPTPPGNRSAS